MEKCLQLMAMFHLLKIRTSIDIFKNEKCKVTFGLEYTLCKNLLCFLVKSGKTKKIKKLKATYLTYPNFFGDVTGNTHIFTLA